VENFASLKDSVQLLGFMPQEQALRYMEDTDYLLLTMTNDFSLPGKLFEYIATGKPTLALSPPGGEVDRILQDTGAGWNADHTDQQAIQQMLIRAYEAARNGRAGVDLRKNRVQRYERPVIVSELAERIRA
jgi:glycosyltransferase involved in cell wall biosynthesis